MKSEINTADRGASDGCVARLVRLLAVAQPVMEAWAKSHELDEWHCRCEDMVGTAYPRRLLPQCAGCRWSMPLEGRYDQLRCTNDDSPEAWGDVEATGCCDSFLPNAESIRAEIKS